MSGSKIKFGQNERGQAFDLMKKSKDRCNKNRVKSCLIKSTIDFVMQSSGCLTYQYIMITAFVAKALNEDVDILSLQDRSDFDGAYDARSLCAKVVYKFQKDHLSNVINGANEDPLVNKPGRYTRLDKDNAASSSSKKALFLLCDNLPKIQTSEEAISCLDYVISSCLDLKEKREKELKELIDKSECSNNLLRNALSNFIDRNFNGKALTLVVAYLYNILLPSEKGYVLGVHHVNQPGRTSKQLGDIDIFKNEMPFMGIEVKDKPFTADDVEKAAKTALKANALTMMFVSGRASGMSAELASEFNEVREKYQKKGLYLGVIPIDNLLDLVLSLHVDSSIHLKDAISYFYKTAIENGFGADILSWISKLAD